MDYSHLTLLMICKAPYNSNYLYQAFFYNHNKKCEHQIQFCRRDGRASIGNMDNPLSKCALEYFILNGNVASYANKFNINNLSSRPIGI